MPSAVLKKSKKEKVVFPHRVYYHYRSDFHCCGRRALGFCCWDEGKLGPLLISQATQLAQEKMDVIAGDRMNVGRGYNYIVPGNYPAENPVSGFPGFNRSVSIICVNAGTLNTNNGGLPSCVSGYAHVTVTVANAAIGSVTVERLVTNY